jgi:cell wall-associated NlpC family hydrolase
MADQIPTSQTLKDFSAERSSKILDAAKKFDGKPYSDGAGEDSGPEDGFDCSGLVFYVISHEVGHIFEYKNTDSLAVHPMLRRLQVPPDALQAGDIILFRGHVGFYDPNPPKGKEGRTLYSATAHGVRNEKPIFWGSALGYFRIRAVSN